VNGWTHSRETLQRVMDVTNKCRLEAERCVDHNLYRPGCVLIGAALEGVLLSTVMLAEPQLKRDNLWPKTSKDVLDWPLGELVGVAVRAGWIEANYRGEYLDLDEGDLGNAVDWVKWLRNLVHPGAFVRELDEGMDLGEQASANAYRVLGTVYDELTGVLDRLAPELEAMRRERTVHTPVHTPDEKNVD